MCCLNFAAALAGGHPGVPRCLQQGAGTLTWRGVHRHAVTWARHASSKAARPICKNSLGCVLKCGNHSWVVQMHMLSSILDLFLPECGVAWADLPTLGRLAAVSFERSPWWDPAKPDIAPTHPAPSPAWPAFLIPSKLVVSGA